MNKSSSMNTRHAVFYAAFGSAMISMMIAGVSVESRYVSAHHPFLNSAQTSKQIQRNAPLSGSVQFSSGVYSIGEAAGSIVITVTRTGDTSGPAAVDYATSDGSAFQTRDYILATGTVRFVAGETSKTFRVLIVDDVYVEGSENLSLTLSNPASGTVVGNPSTAVLTITDDDSTTPTTNPNDQASFFVTQHYYAFLNRLPDVSGLDFWTQQITQCGSDEVCVRAQRITVSNAFFYELEFQQTATYVYRLYRAAFGNDQPFPNPNIDPQQPGEERKLPSYLKLSTDRARITGGANLAQLQLDLANAFVQRPEFTSKYPLALSGPDFVDAILLTINSDIGADLSSQRSGLINLFNSGGRGEVINRLADDNQQTNPINNRAFIDAEYNRGFAATLFFGYLRRDPDIAGFLFRLGQLNGRPLRDINTQRALVCSSINSTEYQQRFSPVVNHPDSECSNLFPPTISYPVNPAVYALGGTIVPNTPINNGGTASSYLITPALPAGLNFNTTSGVISGTPSALSASQNYMVSVSGPAGSANTTLTIAVVAAVSTTGKVVDITGANLSGITVNLSGSATLITTTDGSGNYSFAFLASGGNYSISPSSSNLSFSPANQSFNNQTVNRIAIFVATQTTVTINGKVTDTNNNALNNVSVALTRNGLPAGTVQTDGLGNYSFNNLEAAANYVVTPAGSFNPSSQNFNNLSVNAVANFIGVSTIPAQCSTVSLTRTDYAAASFPFSVRSADFDGDGKSDLAVTNQLSNNISVLLGTGTGSFGPPTNFPAGNKPFYLVVADFNQDSKVDLAATNNDSNNVSVLLGTGTGSFSGATNFNVGSQPRGLSIGDFNSDGKADLVTTNFGANNVSILLGTGNGSFAVTGTLAVGSGPLVATVADFNNDGLSDLIVLNSNSANISILIGLGGGNFAAATNIPVGTAPTGVAINDFNSDGKVDLAVANENSDNISILLGNGNGSFSPVNNFPVGASPYDVVSGDFNGDGDTDLAITEFAANKVGIMLGTGNGAFLAPTLFSVNNTPWTGAAGDYNVDGKLDFAVATSGNGGVSVLLNDGNTCSTQTSLTISGRLTNAANSPLADIAITLSGPTTRVAATDQNGNYSFSNLIPGGNYFLTVQSSYFTFAPSRADFFNLSSSRVANFVAAPLAVPSPTPTPNDDFSNSARDASKWTIGAQTSATSAFDPQVTTAQTNGQLVVTPLTQASGMHFAGYVSANSFDMRNGSAKVEVVKAGTGGVDTIFAVGTDVDNFYRFMVHTPGTATSLAPRARGRDGIEGPLDATMPQLVFQVSVAGQLTSLAIDYHSMEHHFMRFRHVPAMNSIVFETSPNNSDFFVQHTVVLQRSVAALTVELGAGTTNPANPGQTVLDNFVLVTSTFQFSAPSYSINEGDGSILVTVTREGSLADPATVDFATADGTARQKSKYTNAAGTLPFAAGVASRTFRVLLVDNQLAEGEQSLNLLLTNPSGAGLNTPGRAVLTISDNDTTLATGNPLDDAQYFVTQHYYDFLNRVPDQPGLNFWRGQITQCGTDVQCLRTQRITVSNAFFYEQEYQQTGSYVVRLYRAAFGNNQPISNNDNNPKFPNENKKLVNYSVFSTDRARVRGGPSLAQTQLDLANAFVLRSQFLAKYPSTLDGPAYVGALIANINTDNGVDLSEQRQALIDLFNLSGRGAVLYRIADDNTQTNPVDNRAFIDAEYNRAFVLTQYFGYLRRNPDIGGYLFWLTQVNSAPLRALEKQRAMVCSFITSLEYQQRFSPVATHNNTECQ